MNDEIRMTNDESDRSLRFVIRISSFGFHSGIRVSSFRFSRVVACQSRDDYSPAMRDPRLTKLAQVLVNYSVGVKPGQLVRISGPPVASPLVLELFRETVKAGGNA